MTRDNIVSVRLTDEELAALKRRGTPAQVLRSLLRQSPPLVASAPMVGWSNGAGVVLWEDGTVGPTWPAAMT